jgi:hypothetical protein
VEGKHAADGVGATHNVTYRTGGSFQITEQECGAAGETRVVRVGGIAPPRFFERRRASIDTRVLDHVTSELKQVAATPPSQIDNVAAGKLVVQSSLGVVALGAVVMELAPVRIG